MTPRSFTFALSVIISVFVAACDRKASPSIATNPPASKTEWFADITKTSGLQFLHRAGTNYFMADQIGSGVALFDFDGDGLVDVYVVQNGGTGAIARNRLFHQEVNGAFRDVSEGSGVDVAGQGMGTIAGDVNNDGKPDLVVTEYGAVRLFLNLGAGKFREVTREAGLENARWAVPASFIDFDRDGWLDLVVGNYVDYDPTQICQNVHGERDFCGPQAFGGTVARLWRNATTQPGGVPRFEDRTERSGIYRVTGAALGLVCADFDGDGWPDIFFADDGRPNRLFINHHDGTFSEEAASRGLAFNSMGSAVGNMGTAFADADGDGLADLFITHLTQEYHSLFKQGPRGMFTDAIAPSGLQKQSWRGTGFGTVMADFNNDGAPDVAFANGQVQRPSVGQTPVDPEVNPWWAPYAQRSQLFANDGHGIFRDISVENPALCGQALVARTLAVGDLDRDGGLDLVLASGGGPLRVLRNVAPARGHWLKLRLTLPKRGGRDAVGAEVTVRAGGRNRWAVLQPALGYAGSHEPLLHFGLGPVSSVDSIEVLWPDGKRETFPGGPSDRLVELRQGKQ